MKAGDRIGRSDGGGVSNYKTLTIAEIGRSRFTSPPVHTDSISKLHIILSLVFCQIARSMQCMHRPIGRGMNQVRNAGFIRLLLE